MKTQTAQVKQHLLTHNSITPSIAMSRYKIYRLAARILDLRKTGFSVITVPLRTKSGGRVAKYVMG